MGRLSAVFVAICMVLIAGSIGAILFLRFGLDGTESTIVGLIALIGLALFNAVARRGSAATDNSGQVAALAHGVADLAGEGPRLPPRGAGMAGGGHREQRPVRGPGARRPGSGAAGRRARPPGLGDRGARACRRREDARRNP